MWVPITIYMRFAEGSQKFIVKILLYEKLKLA